MKPIIGAIIGAAAVYIIGAFLAWEMNVANWTDMGLAALLIFGPWFALIGAAFGDNWE